MTALLLIVASATGQEFPLHAPGPVLPAQTDTYQIPSPAYNVPQPAGLASGPGALCEDCDFWIVTSRCCPQSPYEATPSCRLDYYRCDGGETPQRAGEAAFRGWLQPGVPVCILVHGSLTAWDTICADSVNICKWFRRAQPGAPVQFIFYSWPSEAITTILPAVDFAVLGHRSEFNGVYLAQFIASLPPESPVSLVGHSLGSRVVTSALHLMGGGKVDGYCLPQARIDQRPIRAVLTASAIDHHWLVPGEKYGCAVHRAEVVLNVRNREDLPLALYPLRCPFSHRALGRAGLSAKDRALLGPLAGKVHELDVTCLIRSGHIFPRYYRHGQIARALAPYVFFLDQVRPAENVGWRQTSALPSIRPVTVAPLPPVDEVRTPATVSRDRVPQTRTTGSDGAHIRR